MLCDDGQCDAVGVLNLVSMIDASSSDGWMVEVFFTLKFFFYPCIYFFQSGLRRTIALRADASQLSSPWIHHYITAICNWKVSGGSHYVGRWKPVTWNHHYITEICARGVSGASHYVERYQPLWSLNEFVVWFQINLTWHWGYFWWNKNLSKKLEVVLCYFWWKNMSNKLDVALCYFWWKNMSNKLDVALCYFW